MSALENRMVSRIYCPKCGRIGAIHGRSDGLNDTVRLNEFVPPVGFRKVLIDWRSANVYLFCMTCGVPAQMDLDE